jgi:rubrerythrin
MAGEAPAALPPEVARVVARTWVFRHRVEREAEARFARLADRLEKVGSPEAVVELARQASRDEHRHAELCEELAREYGGEPDTGPVVAPEIAPERLGLRDQVLYEAVAACAITETESVGVLTTLAPHARGRVAEVLHLLAQDEVGHARIGWAHLEAERRAREVGFLAPYLPRMLEGTVDPGLFGPARPEEEAEVLLGHGVLPRSMQRDVFTRMLEEVILPGLERAGVDSAPARAWLAEKKSDP